MPIYTGVADANGDFNIPFSSNYTGGQKITVTAEKDSAIKTIELFAPSEPTGGGFDGVFSVTGTIDNPGNATVILSTTGDIPNSFFGSPSTSNFYAKIKGLVIEGPVNIIRSYSFLGWVSAKSLSIPISTTWIDIEAFLDWKACTSLNIPKNVNVINTRAFKGWISALTLNIQSESVSSGVIEIEAFSNWSSVKNVTIGPGIKLIKSYSLSGWIACETLKMLSSTPPSITADSLNGLNANCIIQVPAASLSAYKTATNWSVYASKMVGF